jgi:hypothetical protein
MNLKLDLLRDAERRFQGPVSVRFAVRMALAAVGTVVALVLIVVGRGYFATHRSVAEARVAWEKISPHYKDALARQKDLNALQGLDRWLTNWHSARLNTSGLLYDLQDLVPTNIQLTRLTLVSDFDTRAESATARAAKTNAPIVRVRSSLTMEGKASGERAEESANGFVADLEKQPRFGPLLDSVKLQRLDRDPATGDRVFEVNLDFRVRILK